MLQTIVTHYPVQVITPEFLVHGRFEPMGPILDFLNDVNRAYLPLADATLYNLAGKLKPSARPLVILSKSDICGLYVDDAKGRESLRLLKRVEKVIVHMPNLVCRGEIHVGSETRQVDIFDVLVGTFFALTNVALFPLIQLPAEFPLQPELLLAHKSNVQVYYPQ